MEMLRFTLAALFLASGLLVFGVATLGLYRLKYVLNRVHASSKCDTLGGMLMLIGICIITGLSFTTLKIIALVAFIWMTNPLAIFMIGRAEVLTNPRLEDEVGILVVPSKNKVGAPPTVSDDGPGNNTEVAQQ